MEKLSIRQEANMLHTKIKSIIAFYRDTLAWEFKDCDSYVDDKRFVACIIDELQENCRDYKKNIYPLLVEILVYCFNSLPKDIKKDLFVFYRNFFIEYYKKHQTLDNEIQHHIPIFERSFAKAEIVLFGV